MKVVQKLPSVLLGGQCRSVAGGTGDNGVAYHVKRQGRAVPTMVVMPIRRPIGPLIELSVWRAVVNPELYQRSQDPRPSYAVMAFCQPDITLVAR